MVSFAVYGVERPYSFSRPKYLENAPVCVSFQPTQLYDLNPGILENFMKLQQLLGKVKLRAWRMLPGVYKMLHASKQNYECPICGYQGPFLDVSPPTGFRDSAQCTGCGAMERHRLQYLVLMDVFKNTDVSKLNILHFAPEPFFRELLKKHFGHYESADLCMEGVDHLVDIQDLPFEDEVYDFVYASHVLEHIPDDKKAIGEIRRILKPGGVAILPVPIVGGETIEYPEPNPNEAYHVRAPGMDYFERYKTAFSRVEQTSSQALPEKHQLFICEDRSGWPTKECPLRVPMEGKRHLDVVPVCFV